MVDPARRTLPGDLLHEAGHIAVTDPALRPTLDAVSGDPGEEMAAIACRLGRDWPRPGSAVSRRRLSRRRQDLGRGFHVRDYFGEPTLHYYGMAVMPRHAQERGVPPYPHMLRWLR